MAHADILKRSHILIAVIHVTTDQHAFRNDIAIARSEGADGIMVIKDYESDATDWHVEKAYRIARDEYPTWWIGINLLESSTQVAAYQAPDGISGLWLDDSGIYAHVPSSSEMLKEVQASMRRLNPKNPPLLLASVAFKSGDSEAPADIVARMAEPYCDIVVTSGIATGLAPSAQKIKLMRSAMKPESRLAVASGTSVYNVEELMGAGASVFLANTHISEGGRISASKLAALRRLVPR